MKNLLILFSFFTMHTFAQVCGGAQVPDSIIGAWRARDSVFLSDPAYGLFTVIPCEKSQTLADCIKEVDLAYTKYQLISKTDTLNFSSETGAILLRLKAGTYTLKLNWLNAIYFSSEIIIEKSCLSPRFFGHV